MTAGRPFYCIILRCLPAALSNIQPTKHSKYTQGHGQSLGLSSGRVWPSQEHAGYIWESALRLTFAGFIFPFQEGLPWKNKVDNPRWTPKKAAVENGCPQNPHFQRIRIRM
ncbi:uncharacterized protein LOC144075283 [Stigmatopora argus]